jgi:hypothetical protein
MIAIVILTVGIMAQLSALSLSMIRARSSEQRSAARQISSSAIESIFAARDIGSSAGINNWAAINTKDVDSTNGIFEAGFRPVRAQPGADGINGTADDACAATGPCVSGTYTNNSEILTGFQRKIEISDIATTGIIRKRKILVTVRYFIGQLPAEEELETIIADLPFYK